ncbi:MAG: hypothetical protein LBP56_04505 [Odoribacteraceae bacterium]|jgi:hypothetical protein|nr:hypothetical protein [Odoribacteraceae bacterium]
MNKSLIVIAFLLFYTMACASRPQDREMKFGKLKKELKDPPGSFRPAPLWVWNTRVTRADIDRMLQELKEQGFGGAFVHPRPGMITEYLSKEWFDLYKYSLEVGRKLGLDIWIYDENSYPSGFAGGHVPAQMPESYNQGQGLKPEKVERLPENTTDYFLCLKKEGKAFVDITSTLDQYENIPGEYWLYKKTYYGRSGVHGGFSYVDVLYPGVTEKFLEITMSGYEKHFGKLLGTEIKGIFTDETTISSPGGTRWTPDLFDAFQKRWGYDLKEVLPLLGETEENWKQVRHNYMETLTQLFIDRWAKPWFEYCERKNMYRTGHYWEHAWPDMGNGGDNMAMYAWHQMPAIDMLFNQFNDKRPQAQFGNARAVKELRGAANQMGYTRTLSETYGGGGWDVTFQDLKRLGDWEYALGVNFMNQHLSQMTIVGARKYDYPPVFTSVSPWWSNYKSQNDYFARLSMLLSQGEQINDILLLEPTTTAWLYYSHVKGHPKTMEVGIHFQDFVTRLEKSQVEYDLGSENIIKEQGKVKQNSFVVGKRAYKKVVLPPMTENLNTATFRLLKQFVEAGGELITFSSPALVDGKESAELKRFLSENSARIKTYTEEQTGRAIEESLRGDEISFSNIASNDLYHHRRSYSDGELVFLVNSSLTETAKGRVSVKGKALIEIDGMSGEIFGYPCSPRDQFVEAEFILPPAGSLLLFSAASAGKEYPSKPRLMGGETLEAESPLEIKRVQDNVLNIDFCNLVIDGNPIRNSNHDKNLYTVEASHLLYKHFGMARNPWHADIQYKRAIVERDTFKTGDIRVRYHFIVGGSVDKSRVRLVVEQPEIWKVTVNDKPVSADPRQGWLDARCGVYEVGEHVENGVNVVELGMRPMSIYAEIAPVYILGDFALQSAATGWIIREPVQKLELGSWKTQGQPYYSWDISYSKYYTIEDTSARYTLQLKEWNGTLSEVHVNGDKAGIIAYQPYQFDLSPYLKRGNNKIEVRVIGSLKNLLGPHYNHERGKAGPNHWNGVHRQDPGSDYNLFDYGLMEDFMVVSHK